MSTIIQNTTNFYSSSSIVYYYNIIIIIINRNNIINLYIKKTILYYYLLAFLLVVVVGRLLFFIIVQHLTDPNLGLVLADIAFAKLLSCSETQNISLFVLYLSRYIFEDPTGFDISVNIRFASFKTRIVCLIMLRSCSLF